MVQNNNFSDDSLIATNSTEKLELKPRYEIKQWIFLVHVGNNFHIKISKMTSLVVIWVRGFNALNHVINRLLIRFQRARIKRKNNNKIKNE